MGDYIQVPQNKRKAKQLEEMHRAKRIDWPIVWVPEVNRGGKVWICVVENAIFDAALIVSNESEYNDIMADTTGRHKTWLEMDRDVVVSLNPKCEKWLA